MDAMDAEDFCKLLDGKNLSLTEAAGVAFKSRATIKRYRNGEVPIPEGVVKLIQLEPRRTKKRAPGYAGEWHKDRDKPKRKAKKKNGARS